MSETEPVAAADRVPVIPALVLPEPPLGGSGIMEWILANRQTVFEQVCDHMIREGPIWSVDEIATALHTVGHVAAPRLLGDLRLVGVVGNDALTALVGGVWSGAEYPLTSLDPDEWVALFTAAGYTLTNNEEAGLGQPRQRPANPIRLYRGAPESRKLGMSWSSDLAVAQRFAHGGLRGREQGGVWSLLVEPDSILAFIDDRQESEYVLSIEDLDPGDIRPYR